MHANGHTVQMDTHDSKDDLGYQRASLSGYFRKSENENFSLRTRVTQDVLTVL